MTRRIPVGTVCCSDCFNNEGLRLEAIKLGAAQGKCPRCGSQSGAGLNDDQCSELLERFFIAGSMSVGPVGISPYMTGVGNAHRMQFDPTLQSDFETLISIDSLGLRLRAPKTYLVGDTEHWDAFQEMIDYRKRTGNLPENAAAIVDKLLERCRKFVWAAGTRFYRIRKNPRSAISAAAYDSPPAADAPSRLGEPLSPPKLTTEIKKMRLRGGSCGRHPFQRLSLLVLIP